jgi:RHS repeat-associated protein|tara:strand:+ start:18370 stop:23622 length:5253 start_codon:yes stop_codon:yes gene_type:complete
MKNIHSYIISFSILFLSNTISSQELAWTENTAFQVDLNNSLYESDLSISNSAYSLSNDVLPSYEIGFVHATNFKIDNLAVETQATMDLFSLYLTFEDSFNLAKIHNNSYSITYYEAENKIYFSGPNGVIDILSNITMSQNDVFRIEKVDANRVLLKYNTVEHILIDNTIGDARVSLRTNSDNLSFTLLNEGFDNRHDGRPNVIDSERNWFFVETFNNSGLIQSADVSFYDCLAKPIQSQTRDFKSGKTWISETMYDSAGRPLLQSYSSPKEDQIFNFFYKNNFIKKYGGVLTSGDVEFNIEMPPSIDPSEEGTLGWYYSANNSMEPFQDITNRPYAVSVYDELNPGNTRMVSGGKVLDTNGDGTIDESTDSFPQGFSYTVPAAQELYYAFGKDYFPENFQGWFMANGITNDLPIGNDPNTQMVTHRSRKTISIDAQGNERVSFIDLEGNVLATAKSGGATKYEVVSLIGELGFVDVHIPKGISNTDIQLIGTGGFTIHDLRTGNLVSESSLIGGNIYRISHSPQLLKDTVLEIDASGSIISPAVAKGIRYKVNYFNYSLNYYDRANQLKESVQPIGFDSNAFNLATSTPNHTMVSDYNYNASRELQNVSSPDEGEGQFVYREDGQIRFSKNTEQDLEEEFSYTNYDSYGRPIESGICDGDVPYFQPIATTTLSFTGESSLNINGNAITKTGTTNWNTSGFASNEDTGDANFDITFQFSPSDEAVVGVSETNTDGSYSSIHYGFYFFNNQISILSYGKTQVSNVSTYIASDILKIERIDNTLYFYKNEDLLYQTSPWSSTLTTFPTMVIDGSIYTQNAVVSNFNLNTLANTSENNVPPGDFIISGTTCREQVFTVYDIGDPLGIQAALGGSSTQSEVSRVQRHLSGNVSKTYTQNPETSTTWYSYDIYGRVTWMILYVNGLGAKTIDYRYDDATGEVSKIIYQTNDPSERFIHRYSYDRLGNLAKVETSRDNLNFIEHASYSYYHTGELKRTELAEGLQGIDYVYTLSGQLKAINHPGLSSASDPGNDQNDVFGFILDYYNKDYSRTGTYLGSSLSGSDRFDGNIKGLRWRTEGLNSPGPQNGYLFDYNDNSWLKEAAFGTITGTSTYSISSTQDYLVDGLTYDFNGNILSLNRNKDTNGGSNAMDQLQYNYYSGTNQLANVDDVSGNTALDGDIKDQGANNYIYNTIGQLVSNAQDNIAYDYFANGLVKSVTSTTMSDESGVVFTYNDRGHRVSKIGLDTNGNESTKTYYVRDASGQALAIYTIPEGTRPTTTIEYPVYGNSRLGVATQANVFTYQIADHLGNVRAVIQRDGGYTPILTQNFDGIFTVPSNWSSSNTTMSIDTANERLKVAVPSGTANSTQVTFPVVQGNTYNIEFEVDLDETANTLGYQAYVTGVAISANNIATQNGTYTFNFTPTTSGTAKLSFTLGQQYQLLENNYYLDNISVTDISTTSNPLMLAYKDYYPFGMPMPNRNVEGNYRYAYQGQEKDPETGMEAFELRLWDARIARWLTTDPAGQFVSPYLGMGNNPVTGVDPDGAKNIRFDSEGKYIGVDHDVWWHNLLFGNRGQYEDGNGGWKNFALGDQEDDFKNIQDGVINKIQFVTEEQVNELLIKAGVYSEEAQKNPMKYMREQGIGFNKFDFANSKNGITSIFEQASSSLFILQTGGSGDGNINDRALTGLNSSNFGNFLIGAAANKLGIHIFAMRIGAHANSLGLFKNTNNGYQPQLDSGDDQRALGYGYWYANRMHFNK